MPDCRKGPAPSGEACLYFLPEAISLSPIVKTDDVVSERKYIRSGNDNSQQHIKSIKKPPANQWLLAIAQSRSIRPYFNCLSFYLESNTNLVAVNLFSDCINGDLLPSPQIYFSKSSSITSQTLAKSVPSNKCSVANHAEIQFSNAASRLSNLCTCCSPDSIY